MGWALRSAIAYLFASRPGAKDRLLPRWLFLRALAVIYFSAFFSLVFQIRGLIGPAGILPAGRYLQEIVQSLGYRVGVWYAPTLLWLSSRTPMLTALCWAGMLASLLLLINLWPRAMLGICFVCFLSFVSAAQDFSSYQSDGMLLEAGAVCLFFAPKGLRPGLGATHPPSRASLFLLQWEWFRIYFESGAVKLLSGDPEWRHFTAMDEYYQNGPLPTWIGWYAQHLPHRFHAITVYATLALELGVVWMLFLPRRWRIACFLIVTVWQIPVILTANYAFLNYLVLFLGVLLLDDRFLGRAWPRKLGWENGPSGSGSAPPLAGNGTSWHARWCSLKLVLGAVMVVWVFYVTLAKLAWMFSRVPLPSAPATALEPFRIANQYGLFAVMTRGRYEIEFQGSGDGRDWTPYPFRFKPQRLDEPPRIYAPYQPRFCWNLWFASLGSWREYPIVPNTELRLLSNNKDVLALFAGNPFSPQPPRQIRVVLWQYWFTTMAEKRSTGRWWRREFLGLYAPTLEREPGGTVQVIEWPTVQPRE
ncbi:MAG: lipase maturation factor family protein [Acidobacteria bacterium]|nr:lipase maturation factor family protein [Acidobacteriota bacterium]MBV9624760.1 lipase maturation factor family protein [Acidobacteriota bacterium]